MGWAKYHEDIMDAITDTSFYNRVGNYKTKSIDPPVFNCSYCGISFYKKTDLYEHIKRKHNVVTSILVVNGKVVHNESYIKELKSIILVRYDLSDEIFINDEKLEKIGLLNELDITNLVGLTFIRDKKVYIRVGKKSFVVNLISQESIDVKKINATISKWSDDASQGKHVKMANDYSNQMEKICLEGLYNYFIACVSAGKDKEARYEDAYAILSEVADILPPAMVLLKVIAFRFNWVEKLRLLSFDRDIFAGIYDFMSNKETSFNDIYDGAYEIFIEDELEDIIGIMYAYQEGKFEEVESFLKKYTFSNLSEINDINHRDKIYLLLARMALKNGKKYDARRYYYEIQSPFVDEEKKLYIKSM